MRDAEQNAWRESLWRRKPTPKELADLFARQGLTTEDRREAVVEAALTEALGQIPDLPVSSNFNSRVLAKLQVAERKRPVGEGLGDWLRTFLPMRRAVALGFGCVLLIGSWVAYQQFRPDTKALEGLIAVSEVRSLPSAEILADFDAIRMINTTATADEELLVLMQ
jgi:hypothetical protein